MKKGDVIHGYSILEDFVVAGGRSKVTFATKGGKTYFLKEFLAPKYPVPGSPGSDRVKKQKKLDCEQFEMHQRKLNDAIARKCSYGGNLVFAVDFFREGPLYYKVSEKIEVSSFSCSDISRLTEKEIIMISMTVAHSVRILHNLHIVHGDLKPDNILIKKTPTGYSGKLIDLDDSYFSGEPPKNHENLVGTPEYYSPEQLKYIMDEEDEIDGAILTCKSDVFTLGIILCEYFTGKKPIYDSKYSSTCSAVIGGGEISFTKRITNKNISDLIRRMLYLKPEDRPSIEDVFNALNACKMGGKIYPPKIDPPKVTGGCLRGKGLDENKPPKTSGLLRIGKGLNINKD